MVKNKRKSKQTPGNGQANPPYERETQNEAEIEILPPEEEASLPEDEPVDVDDSASENVRIEAKAKSKSLVPLDALQIYMREIGQYPPLSRDQETKLAIRYRETKDLEAAYKLVVHNLRLVVMIAREYQRAARNLLDLVQEGNIGLMEAVKNFDPYRNTRFPSYAAWWVRAYIVRFLIANWRLVKIGTTQAQRKLFFNLQKEKEKLEREGFYPAPKLLAERLDVREQDVVEMEQRLGLPDLSVDAPVNTSEGESSLHSVLPSEALSAEQLLAKGQAQELLQNSLSDFANTLDEKERAILSKRLLSEEKATLNDLATEFSLSKERIRQLENRLKDKLKSFILDKYPGLSAPDFEI